MKLRGDEKLTEFLLNKLVMRHVRSDDLERFAAHLKISTAEYDELRHDFPLNTREIKRRVSCFITKLLGLRVSTYIYIY